MITRCAVKYGPAESSEQEREQQERRHRQVARPVEDRHEQHQRRARPRPRRASTACAPNRCDERSRGQPGGGEPDRLGEDHERHASRRARRRQHEPGKREPGHLRAGRRDDLGEEQRAQRAVPEDLGAAHARSSSRIRGIGEKSRNTAPSRQPTTAIQSVGRRPIARAEHAAEERSERPRPVVEEPRHADDAAANGLRDQHRQQAVLVDVEDHHADAREELAGEQHRAAQPVRAVRQREEHHRSREEDRADDDRAADSEPPPHARRDQGACERAERGRAEDEPDRAGAEAERAARVEDEDREDEEAEEVDRARAARRWRAAPCRCAR